MPHGFRIFNEVGEEVVDNNFVYHQIETGVTISLTDIYQAEWLEAIAAGKAKNPPGAPTFHEDSWVVRVNSPPCMPNFFGTLPYAHVAGSPTGYHYYISSNVIYVEALPRAVSQEMCFFKLKSDDHITCMVTAYQNEDNGLKRGGMWHFQNSVGFSNYDYMIASSDVTTGVATGNTGMQIFNEDGVKTFDSRLPLLPVFDSYYLSSAQMDDVLVNGNPLEITLRKPVDNVYVACPYFCAYALKRRASTQNRLERVGIRQTNSTTVVLERTSQTYSVGTSLTERTFTHDAILLFARPPSSP